MKSFNVIIFNVNKQKFESYDIMPYLIQEYRELNKHRLPKNYDEIKEFIKQESLYKWWSRCEYEIILLDWPNQKFEEKWDVYKQISMNIDIITNIFINNIKTYERKKV